MKIGSAQDENLPFNKLVSSLKVVLELFPS